MGAHSYLQRDLTPFIDIMMVQRITKFTVQGGMGFRNNTDPATNENGS